MTHSLHRKGTINDLKKDYVIIAMLATGVNDKSVYADAKQRQLRVGEIMKNNNPTNLLNEAGWRLSSVVQGCFSDINDVKNVLKTIKKEDLGISIVVSGLISEIKDLCQEIGLKMHTVNLSLGEFGKKSILPPEKTLEITTMCGHHCISSQSVEHYVEQIKKGKISLEKAAEKLTAPCVCGIFNTNRAKQVLNELIE
jgi:soluble P-type ATPase